MTYYTRLQEDPSSATLMMLQAHPWSRVEVVPAGDRYGRAVVIRPIHDVDAAGADAVHVCAGDNPLFVPNVIALTHAHNARIDATSSRNRCDGI